jgi:hypothetical protein
MAQRIKSLATWKPSINQRTVIQPLRRQAHLCTTDLSPSAASSPGSASSFMARSLRLSTRAFTSKGAGRVSKPLPSSLQVLESQCKVVSGRRKLQQRLRHMHARLHLLKVQAHVTDQLPFSLQKHMPIKVVATRCLDACCKAVAD